MRTFKVIWREVLSRTPWLIPLVILSASVYSLQTVSIWLQRGYLEQAQLYLQGELPFRALLGALLLFYLVRSFVGGFVIPFGAAKDLYYEDAVTEAALGSVQQLGDRIHLEYYEAPLFYQLLSRAQEALTGGAMRQVINNISASLELLFGLVVMLGTLFALNYRYAAVAVLGVLPIFAEQLRFASVFRLLRRRLQEKRRLLEQQQRHLLDREYYLETLQNSATAYFSRRWQELHAEITAEEEVLQREKLRFNLVTGLVKAASACTVIALAATDLAQGQLSVGSFSATLALLMALQSSCSFAAARLGDISGQLHEIQAISAIYDLEQQPTDLPTASVAADIELSQVCFCYPNSEEPALVDINLKLKKGEKIAVLGANGAGKTTLAQLILGLYQPTEGEAFYGTTNAAKADHQALYRQMSGVFQGFGVYQMSIAENLALAWGGTAAGAGATHEACAEDEEAMLQALRQAGFPLERFDAGLQTMLGTRFGGVELSGGEGQKLALARCYLRQDAELLLVDEPTAALDPLAEAQFHREILAASGDRTTIILSHRLGSAQLADRIIVLDKGRIREQGSPAELLAQGGIYAEMVTRQAGLYRR